MKLQAGSFFLAVVACLLWVDTSCESTPQLSVALKTEQPKPSFKSGAPIKIEIILTNTSNDTVPDTIPLDGNAYGFYKVYVRNVNGATVPKTPAQLHDETDTFVFLRDWDIELKPGQSEEQWDMLNELFDLSTPGTYIVQVERGWWDDPAVQPALKSNPITITVTP